MTITVRKGNILTDPLAKEGFIIHGCNCHGVMGSGIAAAIKATYPIAFTEYLDKHKTSGLSLGTIQVVDVSATSGNALWIINAMTQKNFGAGMRQVSYDAVESCFTQAAAQVVAYNKARCRDFPLMFPKIGAGLGGGNWDIIEKIIDVSVPKEIEKILYVLE